MSLALRMTTVAVALAIAGGAGYWLARVQHGAAPATPAGAPGAMGCGQRVQREEVGKGFARVVEHALDQGQQLGFVEGLLDEVEGALFHGVHRHGHVAVAGDEDDGQGGLVLDQAVL